MQRETRNTKFFHFIILKILSASASLRFALKKVIRIGVPYKFVANFF